jgi:hypothetical protein
MLQTKLEAGLKVQDCEALKIQVCKGLNLKETKYKLCLADKRMDYCFRLRGCIGPWRVRTRTEKTLQLGV